MTYYHLLSLFRGITPVFSQNNSVYFLPQLTISVIEPASDCRYRQLHNHIFWQAIMLLSVICWHVVNQQVMCVFGYLFMVYYEIVRSLPLHWATVTATICVTVNPIFTLLFVSAEHQHLYSHKHLMYKALPKSWPLWLLISLFRNAWCYFDQVRPIVHWTIDGTGSTVCMLIDELTWVAVKLKTTDCCLWWMMGA